MSSSISLSKQATWWTSGLFYEKLMLQVQAAYPDPHPAHPDLLDTLNALPIVGDFSADDYEAEFGRLLARMIYTVARDTRDGILQPGPVLNADGSDRQFAYVQALVGLLELFEADGRYAKRLDAS